MRFLFLLLALTCRVTASLAAQDAPPRLIVRVDDLGFSQSGNEGIEQTIRHGIATSVEVIVPAPWFPDAVRRLADLPGVDVGVHLALTSEWDGMKWRPLTRAPSLSDSAGYLRPMVHPHPEYAGQSLIEGAWKLEEIETEFRAQIELARRLLPRLTHFSGHMGCTVMTPQVRGLSDRLAREYGLIHVDTFPGLRPLRYLGPSRTAAEKLASFLAALAEMQSGETYVFVDHPALDTPELRAISHHGYDWVAEDRHGVTALLVSPRVREALALRKIQLVGYADAVKTAPPSSDR